MHITKLFAKCKYLSKHKHLPDGIQKWRTAQIGYMLAIQQFVNNRERTKLESDDCAAFYKYVNSQRVCRKGVAPLMDAHGDLAVTAAQQAEALNGQFSSVFTMENGNLPSSSSCVCLSDLETSRGEPGSRVLVQADNSFSARRRPVLWADIQDVVHYLLWGTTFTDRGVLEAPLQHGRAEPAYTRAKAV